MFEGSLLGPFGKGGLLAPHRELGGYDDGYGIPPATTTAGQAPRPRPRPPTPPGRVPVPRTDAGEAQAKAACEARGGTWVSANKKCVTKAQQQQFGSALERLEKLKADCAARGGELIWNGTAWACQGAGAEGGGGHSGGGHSSSGPAPAPIKPPVPHPGVFSADIPQWGGYAAFRAPTDLSADPGYQFRLNEALQALGNRQSATGISRGGAAAGALTRLASDLASQEYRNAFERSVQQHGLNRLQALDDYGAAHRGLSAQERQHKINLGAYNTHMQQLLQKYGIDVGGLPGVYY